MNADTLPLDADPAAVIASFERRAQRFETPCGDGVMVWHRWGNGPPAVLCHGSHGAWSHWIRNIDALATDGQLVIIGMQGGLKAELNIGALLRTDPGRALLAAKQKSLFPLSLLQEARKPSAAVAGAAEGAVQRRRPRSPKRAKR